MDKLVIRSHIGHTKVKGFIFATKCLVELLEFACLVGIAKENNTEHMAIVLSPTRKSMEILFPKFSEIWKSKFAAYKLSLIR